jgi:hypothetical protein
MFSENGLTDRLIDRFRGLVVDATGLWQSLSIRGGAALGPLGMKRDLERRNG